MRHWKKLTTSQVTQSSRDPLYRQPIPIEAPSSLTISQEYDLVNEPEAKTRWQRSKPPGMVVGLPGYLVGGEWVGVSVGMSNTDHGRTALTDAPAQTMDEYEEAVEGQYLPSFLKQDIDLDLGNSAAAGTGEAAGGTRSVGEAELERLMREMTTEDLDKLAAEVGVETSGGVGLINPEGAIPTENVEPEEAAMAAARQGTEQAAAPSTSDAGEMSEKTLEDRVLAVRKGIMGTPGETPPLDMSSSSGGTSGLLDGLASAASGAAQTAKDAAETVVAQVKDGVQEVGAHEKAASGVTSSPPPSATSNRRQSKAEIAAEIQNAGSLDDILQALNKADGSADKEKEKVD